MKDYNAFDEAYLKAHMSNKSTINTWRDCEVRLTISVINGTALSAKTRMNTQTLWPYRAKALSAVNTRIKEIES